jgi:hypothetical protein
MLAFAIAPVDYSDALGVRHQVFAGDRRGGHGTFGWVLRQQVLSNLEHFDCRLGAAALGIVANVLIWVCVITGGVVCWRLRARAGDPMRFIGTVGAVSAAVFLFAIVLQILATLIVPVCAP